MIALVSVLSTRRMASVLTTTSEIGCPLWLDPAALPFRRAVEREIRHKILLLKPFCYETTSDNRRSGT